MDKLCTKGKLNAFVQARCDCGQALTFSYFNTSASATCVRSLFISNQPQLYNNSIDMDNMYSVHGYGLNTTRCLLEIKADLVKIYMVYEITRRLTA